METTKYSEVSDYVQSVEENNLCILLQCLVGKKLTEIVIKKEKLIYCRKS